MKKLVSKHLFFVIVLILQSVSLQAISRTKNNVRPNRITKIFSAQIKSFDDDKIETLNNDFQLPVGFTRKNISRPKPASPIRVHTVADLKVKIDEGYRVSDLDVRGSTREFISSEINPVIKAIHDRKLAGSIPGERSDGLKIGLAIEGGGMRGCVACGMATGLWHLGLSDSVDIVYGSSAGSLVGAYLITHQLPYFGPEIYYNLLTSAGEDFIDKKSILRCCGLGLFDVRPKSLMNLIKERIGKPVLNLNYLLDYIVQFERQLDWKVLWDKQINQKQILKVVASGLISQKAVVMTANNSNFQSLKELAECMRASMLLPGVTGDIVRLKGQQMNQSANMEETMWREYSSRIGSKLEIGSEPLSDAVIYEPVPYRSAVTDDCTHVLVLRTRADGVSATAKMSVIEKMIIRRYFGRKLKLPNVVSWMLNQYHKLIYAEDILLLNEANKYGGQVNVDGKNVSLFCVALPEGGIEVQRMETRQDVILENVRLGFAATFDHFQLDPLLKGKGYEEALKIWPDSVLLGKGQAIRGASYEAFKEIRKFEKILEESDAKTKILKSEGTTNVINAGQAINKPSAFRRGWRRFKTIVRNFRHSNV